MSNFFYKSSAYPLFKKAMKTTRGEPIVLNLLSTDSSLKTDEPIDQAPVQRKNLSNKFEPSPFGKFFGPRKQRTTPVDMSDFSSWKNKNYRQTEKNIGEEAKSETPRLTLADFMKKNADDKKFNDLDQLTTENQKPIDQISTSDPTYKKYSLDSFLHKYEEQTKVKDKFDQNDDLLEPLQFDLMQQVVPDSSQDENFMSTSDVKIEDVSFDGDISGEKFAFEGEDLDKVRSRLDKKAREEANIKEKQTEKVISTNELTEIAKDGEEDDSFNLTKLGVDDEIQVDDIEKINEKFAGGASEESKDVPKVSHKTFIEINKTPSPAKPVEEPVDGVVDDTVQEIKTEPVTQTKGTVIDADIDVLQGLDVDSLDEDEMEMDPLDETEGFSGLLSDTEDEDDLVGEDIEEHLSKKKISRDDLLTKDDFRTITDEFMTKFTEMYKKDAAEPVGFVEPQTYTQAPAAQIPTIIPVDVSFGEVQEASEQQQFVADPAAQMQPQGMQPVDQPVDQSMIEPSQSEQLLQQQAELQAKILEMIEEKKKVDSEAESKLKQAELEKQRVTEEYESRLKELEQSIKARDEESKKKAYLDKLKSDIKLKKAETNFKKREEQLREMEKKSSEKMKIGVMLKKELKNNLNMSNLEMDKKLLEVASKIKRDEEADDQSVLQKKPQIPEPVEEIVEEVVEEEPKPAPKKTASKTTTRKKTTMRSRSHTRTPRRKIDSDIIGGINFD